MGSTLQVFQLSIKIDYLIFDYDTLSTYYKSLERSILGMKVVVKADSVHLSVLTIFLVCNSGSTLPTSKE